MATPYMTSDDLIAAISRKISVPTSQNMFTSDDFLAFLNEELMASQVPSVLQYHEEYFVYSKTVELKANTSRYQIPSRAIGMKLRDVFMQDDNNNLYPLTRIAPEDRPAFQYGSVDNSSSRQFYVENNHVVLMPGIGAQATGSILFTFYMRPNQLVDNDRAAIISNFSKTITISYADVVSGDTVTIDDQEFEAGTDFAIGANGTATAQNLASAISSNGIATATSSNSTVTILYDEFSYDITTSNEDGFSIQTTQGILFESIPTHITNGLKIDFLKTDPGHQILNYDVKIPASGISGSTISFTESDVPDDIMIGDYICLANECIIPMLPPDLHTLLAERASSRVLAALGDRDGLAVAEVKIKEMEFRQGTMLDNRVEGAPKKVLNLNSALRHKKSTRRGY